MDLLGLGAGASGGLSSELSQEGAPPEKRRKLRHYDLLPAQVLNPMGMSGIEAVDLGRLYQTMVRGNKACAAYSELCFPEADRRGVALSRLSQVMMAAIERIRDCQALRDVIKDEVLSVLDEEANRLYPHFKELNKGSGTADGGGTIRSIAYTAAPPAGDGDPEEAAAAVHAWLLQVSSPLRSALAVFSAGGLFYVGQCHEKGARAVVRRVPIDVGQFQAAALARTERAPDLSATELGGLARREPEPPVDEL